MQPNISSILDLFCTTLPCIYPLPYKRNSPYPTKNSSIGRILSVRPLSYKVPLMWQNRPRQGCHSPIVSFVTVVLPCKTRMSLFQQINRECGNKIPKEKLETATECVLKAKKERLTNQKFLRILETFKTMLSKVLKAMQDST